MGWGQLWDVGAVMGTRVAAGLGAAQGCGVSDVGQSHSMGERDGGWEMG